MRLLMGILVTVLVSTAAAGPVSAEDAGVVALTEGETTIRLSLVNKTPRLLESVHITTDDAALPEWLKVNEVQLESPMESGSRTHTPIDLRVTVLSADETEISSIPLLISDADGGKWKIDVPVKAEPARPAVTSLDANFPNPFNPTTTIPFSLSEQTHVRLSIYNSLGQRITTLVNEQFDAGSHTIVWNCTDDYGRHVSSGQYFYRLEAGEYSKTLKMTVFQ